ncbi:peptidase [Flavisolibacter tropicus]|uniref:Peptidase n=1 Tax=Flavisolibacter tropicus TaxID=1492898 RepID=A0A172U3H2_9BACT|nr:peptidase [Flavisolibacter tropicus]
MIYIITAFCIAIAQPAIAQKQTPPAGGKAKDFKLPAKKTQSYANGLKSTTIPYGIIPKATISLIIKTGNVHEGPNQVWLADLTGRMLREGTANADFAALSKKVAMMGGSLNVSVGPTQTTISGSVLSEYAPEFIRLISGLVQQPAFPASEIERLKGNMKRQLVTQKASPQSQAQEQFMQAIYKDHPYGRIYPTEEMINSYTVDMVKDFYEKNFGARRSVIYVAGKFDESAVASAINSSLSKWKEGPEVSYPPVNLSPVVDTLLVDRKGAPQTTLMVGMPVITPTNKDYVPLLVTNSLLGGSFGSRITSNIRENKGYTYSPFSTIQNRKGSALWFEQADITSEHTVDALNEIEKEIKRLQMEAPTKEELAGIQNYEAGIFVLQNSTPNGIIGQLNFLDLYGLDDSYLNNLVKNIYAVTPEKVSETAKKYVQYDKMTKVMIGDKEAVQQQIEKQKAMKKTF